MELRYLHCVTRMKIAGHRFTRSHCLTRCSESSVYSTNLPYNRPVIMVYRKAILDAIDQLHDYHSRSSVDAIRRHVESNLPPDLWNNTLFTKNLLGMVEDGELELHESYCELSSEFKKKRIEQILLNLKAKGAAYEDQVLVSIATSHPHHGRDIPKKRSSYTQSRESIRKMVEKEL
jgi:linker histone H1 and H5 family